MNYAIDYREIKERKPDTIRSIARDWALSGLTTLNTIKGVNNDLLNKPRVQFLYIHHVFKDERKDLIILMESLSKNHHFISYSEGVQRALNGNIDKPYIVLSSDDGFKNNLEAAKILNDLDISACFFINPSTIAETNYERIKSFCAEKLHFPPVEFLNWQEVEQLLKWGHEIGSHTMEHSNIAEMPEQAIIDDMAMSYELINRYCNKAEHFAFPYGRFSHFDEIGRKAVFNAGFQSCANAERGCHVPHTQKIAKEDLCIRRDHVILGWNLSHIMYFLATNSKKANFKNNFFPYKK